MTAAPPMPASGVAPAPAAPPRRRVRGIIPTRREGFAVLASAALFAIAFPPFPFVVPIFVALVPVAVDVARRADHDGHPWQAARVGFWFGVLGYGANLYWIAVALLLYTKLALLGYLGALLWLGPFVGAALAALFVARRLTGWPLAILLPLTWTASEVLLNYASDLAFPWLPLGLAVARVPLLAQLADLSGVHALSFWIAAVNGTLADAWLWRFDRAAAWRRALIAPALVVLVAAYGAWRMHSIVLRPLAPIAVVQPDIPEEAKLTIEDPTAHVGRLTAMTRATLAQSGTTPQLVMWPETALDRFLWQYPGWADSLRAAVAGHPTPILTGFMDSGNPWQRPFPYWNAALVTNAAGGIGGTPPYHKHYLVPVVERVPFLNPAWFAGVDYFGGFEPGTPVLPYRFAFGTGGVLICYESIFPQLTLRYAREGAAVLLNITNDAWFQRSTAPYQHWAQLPLRAIETRLPVVRAANTGISGWVDPLGRVRAETPLFVPRTAVYRVERTDVRSPYVILGDWVGGISAACTAAFIVGALWGARRRGTAASALV